MDTGDDKVIEGEVLPALRAGSRKGRPNLLPLTVKEMILQALDESGGVDYLKTIAKERPDAFCALLGRILPKEQVDAGGEVIIHVRTGVPRD